MKLGVVFPIKLDLGEDREDVLEPLSGCVETKEKEAVGVVKGQVDGNPVRQVLGVTRQLQ